MQYLDMLEYKRLWICVNYEEIILNINLRLYVALYSAELRKMKLNNSIEYNTLMSTFPLLYYYLFNSPNLQNKLLKPQNYLYFTNILKHNTHILIHYNIIYSYYYIIYNKLYVCIIFWLYTHLSVLNKVPINNIEKKIQVLFYTFI